MPALKYSPYLLQCKERHKILYLLLPNGAIDLPTGSKKQIIGKRWNHAALKGLIFYLPGEKIQ